MVVATNQDTPEWMDSRIRLMDQVIADAIKLIDKHNVRRARNILANIIQYERTKNERKENS